METFWASTKRKRPKSTDLWLHSALEQTPWSRQQTLRRPERVPGGHSGDAKPCPFHLCLPPKIHQRRGKIFEVFFGKTGGRLGKLITIVFGPSPIQHQPPPKCIPPDHHQSMTKNVPFQPPPLPTTHRCLLWRVRSHRKHTKGVGTVHVLRGAERHRPVRHRSWKDTQGGRGSVKCRSTICNYNQGTDGFGTKINQ